MTEIYIRPAATYDKHDNPTMTTDFDAARHFETLSSRWEVISGYPKYDAKGFCCGFLIPKGRVIEFERDSIPYFGGFHLFRDQI